MYIESPLKVAHDGSSGSSGGEITGRVWKKSINADIRIVGMDEDPLSDRRGEQLVIIECGLLEFLPRFWLNPLMR